MFPWRTPPDLPLKPSLARVGSGIDPAVNRRLYLSQFLVMMSGSAVAQLANLASYPLLARLYTPTEFGVFAMFVAVAAIPGALACGRFDLIVPIARTDERPTAFSLCLQVAAIVGIVSALGAAALWPSRAGYDGAIPLLFGLCVFLSGATNAATLFIMRNDMFRLSSASLLVRTGVAVAAQIGFAWLAADGRSLIAGFVLGLVAQALFLGVVINRTTPLHRPRTRDLWAVMQRYRRQVLFDIPSTIIFVVSNNAITFALSGLYSERVVGLYSIGNRLASAPLQLFNDGLAQVFFQKAAAAQEESGGFWPVLRFNLFVSGALSVGVLVGIWLLARPLITLYLGRNWAPAAEMLIVMAPMLAIRSLCHSIATAALVLKRPHWLLIHHAASAGMLAAAILIAYSGRYDAITFIELASWLLGVEYALFTAMLILAVRHKSRAVGIEFNKG